MSGRGSDRPRVDDRPGHGHRVRRRRPPGRRGRLVTQRLQRIESLTGLDLADPEAVVQARAALTVLDVAGFRFEDGEP